MQNKDFIELSKKIKKYGVRTTKYIIEVPVEMPELIKNETASCSPERFFKDIHKLEHQIDEG